MTGLLSLTLFLVADSLTLLQGTFFFLLYLPYLHVPTLQLPHLQEIHQGLYPILSDHLISTVTAFSFSIIHLRIIISGDVILYS